jgi:hypothetical protein
LNSIEEFKKKCFIVLTLDAAMPPADDLLKLDPIFLLTKRVEKPVSISLTKRIYFCRHSCFADIELLFR